MHLTLFKDNLQQHVYNDVTVAMTSCWELEQALRTVTGRQWLMNEVTSGLISALVRIIVRWFQWNQHICSSSLKFGHMLINLHSRYCNILFTKSHQWKHKGLDCAHDQGLYVIIFSEAFARDSLAIGSWRFLDWTNGGWGLVRPLWGSSAGWNLELELK